MGAERAVVSRLALGALLLLATGSAHGQILPPIYKPLPVEEAARFRFAADSLRAQAAEVQARADALSEGARTLRQNGTGVVEKLREQAHRLADQAALLESQAASDALTAGTLRAQAEEFARRAAEREARIVPLRAEIVRLLVPAASLDSGSALLFPRADSLAAPDSAAPTRVRELRGEVRADSLTAVTFRAQADELTAQARAREAGAAAARERAAEARAQEAQLRAFAEEIASGRTASEGTAARLERQAGELARGAERQAAEATASFALAEEWRVQAGRSLFPVRSRVDAMRFYGEEGRAVLRNLVFSVASGGGAGTIHSELVSDYAGPVRVGAGLVLAEAGSRRSDADPDSASGVERARERFFAGGGNFVLYGSLPLAFARSSYHSLTLQTLSKVGLDVPAGRQAAADGVGANLDLGVETYATFNTFGGKFKTFALLRSAYALGNDAFHEGLGRAGEGGGFPYAQLTFGTEVASAAKVLLSGALGPGNLSRQLSLTVQVAPSRE